MASLTIRNLDEPLKRRLRVRAASHGRSMEEEVRVILRTALADAAPPATDLAARIRGRFTGFGDVALPIAPREPVRSIALPVDAATRGGRRTAKGTATVRRHRSGR